jgi:signal transduction histidine kinase
MTSIQKIISIRNALVFCSLAISFFVSSLQAQSIKSCGTSIYDLNREDIRLESSWKFRKGDNLDWKEVQVEEAFWISRNIPDYGISKTDNISGYHWYRCTINLPENFIPPKEPLGIRIGKIRDIDETFFNGKLIGKTGALVPVMQPDFHKERIYPLPSDLWIPGENVLAIRVYASGFQQGLKKAPIIATEKELIQSNHRENSLAVGFGHIFILMGIYFLMGAFIRGLRRENTFFGLFSISIGLYTLVRSQYRYELFDSFVASYTFELMILIPLPILFVNFLIFHLDEKRNYLVLLNEAILGVLFLTTPFVNTIKGWNLIIQIFNYSLPLSLIITGFYIYRNYKHNFNKLKFILIGLIGLFPTIIIDSLSAIEVISMEGTIYFGFFFFLIFISVQLSEEMLSSLQKFIALESELIRMEKIKTGFLLNISSEFKNGIEKISETISKLKGKSKTADKKHLESLDALVSTTISMIDEAVLLRKLDEKEYFPENSTFDAGELIKNCLHTIERKMDQKRRNLFINIFPEPAVVHTDRLLFTAIVRNLIENAFQYTDKTVRVDIEFQLKPNEFSFSVSDEGIGMSIFEQENLFKKFVRGEKDNHIPGAGIGLTLCKQAAMYMGGDIRVKSSEGMGSIFTITAPIGK